MSLPHPRLTTYVILILTLISCFLIAPSSHAELSSDDFDISIDTQDHDHITFNEIETIIKSQRFTVLEDGKGASSKGNPWVKVEWDKSKITDETFIINDFISQAYEDFYLIKDNTVIATHSSGYAEPFDIRPIKHFKFVADVSEADYLLIKTCCNPSVPIYFRLLSKQEFTEQYYEALIWYAMVYSIVIILVIYNLFIYLYLRDKQYLMYCYYLTSMLINLLSLSGIGKQFLWSNMPHAEAVYLIVGINSSIASMLFQLAFLDKKYVTHFNKVLMNRTIGLHLFILFFYFFASIIGDTPRVFNVLVQIIVITGMIITDYVIIRNIMAGDKNARILLFGYLLINIASIIFVLHYNGYFSHILWSARIVDIALVCEALILSLALAQKIQRLREEKSQFEEQQLHIQKQFSKQLLQVQEVEKKQLGSALHDNFTHQLLILKTNVIKHLGNQAEEIKQVDKILSEMRDLTHVIHPHLLEKLGLKEALIDMLDKTADTYDLDINFASDEVALNEEQSIIVYRIVQESLNNIIKHANASECLIAIKQSGEHVRVIIKDDGDGFNSESKNGLGLTAIDKRCQILSGTLTINSDEHGTTLRIIFPNQSVSGQK